jgi:glycosyltransferase involved in cell wall biosynthesis
VQGLRVLLVGTRILPFRHAGDKNFWLDVVDGLRRRGHEVEIVTTILEEFPDGNNPIRRVKPVLMFLRPDGRFNASHDYLAGTNNYVSKTLSLPRIVTELRRRRKAFRPDVMHFIDNYGPGMIGLRHGIGRVPLTVSAPTYQPDRPLYDLFLRSSFASFDTIVPLSEAYRRRLLELRFRPSRVRTIRWGADLKRFTPPSDEQKAAARQALGLRDDQHVVLWTGFLQQTNEPDLRLALQTAKVSLQNDGSSTVFLFCFKPEHFKDRYRAFERPGLRVFGSAEAFRAARTATDVLLSPFQDVRSTAAPPLAWLEALAMGIPIVTTAIPGAEEAVMAGQSGYTVSTPEAASRRLEEMKGDDRLRRDLREGSRRIAVERYSVDRALDEYVDLWSTMANGGQVESIARAHPGRQEMQA